MFAARLSEEEIKMLDALCREQDRNRSYIVRKLIQVAYKKLQRKPRTAA